MTEMNVPCCDNCLLSKGDNAANPLTVSESADEEFDDMIVKLVDEFEERLLKQPKPPKVVIPMPSADPEAKPIKRRVKDRLKLVKKALLILRYKFWKENYGDTMFTELSILPDSILASLAAEAKIRTMEDLAVALPNWDFAEELGPSALETIARVDGKWISQNEAEKLERANARKEESKRKKQKREDAARLLRENISAQKKAEARNNWTAYGPSLSVPATPVRSVTPVHAALPTPPQYPAYQTSPQTPVHAHYQGIHYAGGSFPHAAMPPPPLGMPPPPLMPPPPPFPQYYASGSSPVVQTPVGYYYAHPVPMYYPTTPVRTPARPPSAPAFNVPSTPAFHVYPTPPFTPAASTSRLPQANTPSFHAYPGSSSHSSNGR